jgi:(S)-3,5-dihydroxyphenylglycine transaminase
MDHAIDESDDRSMNVMNYLNEIADEFPSAISLAAGRPRFLFNERLSNEALARAMIAYERHASGEVDGIRPRASLLQYGRTAGLIPELVAAQLRTDERVTALYDRLLITSGCQEALSICVAVLCPDPSDTMLVCNPTYAGVIGAARASRVPAFPLSNETNDLGEAIEKAVYNVKLVGRRARVLYLIPSFDNPTARVLNEDQRRNVLYVCARNRIVILEDNAYGLFRYEGQALAPMAALDESGSVLYLSTFSKTLAPALRVGAVTVPRTLFGDEGAAIDLMNQLIERKSFMTVNTSQISQAIVGGILVEQNGTLKRWIEPALLSYHRSRDAMLSQLRISFASISDRIHWNCPAGGFFLTMDLPFPFDAEAARVCAEKHGVLVTPMRFFALDKSQDRRVRLSFSGEEPDQIRMGIEAFAMYISTRLESEQRGWLQA